MGKQNLSKPLDRQVLGWCFEVAVDAVVASRSDESGYRIVTLQYKLPAKQFIAPHVRGANELRENLEMGFMDTDGPIRCIAVLKHEEITEEGLWTLEISTFSEGRPEVQGAANCLLCSVVEIVTERGTDL